TGVSGGGFRISRTSDTGAAYVSPASVNARYSVRGPLAAARGFRFETGVRAGLRVRLAMGAPRIVPLPVAAVQDLLDERRGVEHERDALIAVPRGAGEAAHRRERRTERLDHDVLLADERAHAE